MPEYYRLPKLGSWRIDPKTEKKFTSFGASESETDATMAEIVLWVHLERYRKALEGLTPSGSEFVGDPEYCAKYVKRKIDIFVDMVKRKVLRERTFREVISDLINHGNLLRTEPWRSNWDAAVRCALLTLGESDGTKDFADSVSSSGGESSGLIPTPTQEAETEHKGRNQQVPKGDNEGI